MLFTWMLLSELHGKHRLSNIKKTIKIGSPSQEFWGNKQKKNCQIENFFLFLKSVKNDRLETQDFFIIRRHDSRFTYAHLSTTCILQSNYVYHFSTLFIGPLGICFISLLRCSYDMYPSDVFVPNVFYTWHFAKVTDAVCHNRYRSFCMLWWI